MLASVYTPFHKSDVTFLRELYATLREQRHEEWEWVLVPNGEGLRADLRWLAGDARVRVCPMPFTTGGVGALKAFASAQCRGEALVEADWDDLLTPDCLAEVVKTFEGNPGAVMVYSNFAAVNGDWSPRGFNDAYGWETRPWEFRGRLMRETVAPAPHPAHLALIYFAPNHVRAWRAEAYRKMGGHRPEMAIGDDHELCCRSYLAGALGSQSVVHIDKCLYVYRVHGKNTWLDCVESIKGVMLQTAMRTALPMWEKWAKGEGLELLDLCGGIDPRKGYQSVDRAGGEVEADLEKAWPFGDGTAGVIRAQDAVEHLRDPVHVMNEAWRVLAHGGLLAIDVPSTDGRGAFQDPTHVSFWNRNSAWYYTRRQQARYVPAFKGRFMALHVDDYWPSKWHEEHRILYTRIWLVAVKTANGRGDSPRLHGALEI